MSEIEFDAAKWLADSDGTWLCLRCAPDAARTFCQCMEYGKKYIGILKRWRKKRSLDANAYCWVLLDKLADALRSTKEELYRDAVKQVGVFRDYHLLPEEAESFSKLWTRQGTGWVTEQADYTQDGDHLVIRAYFGSSQYNSKQMSRLIDHIVEECRLQNIETMTPLELERLKEDWRCTK